MHKYTKYPSVIIINKLITKLVDILHSRSNGIRTQSTSFLYFAVWSEHAVLLDTLSCDICNFFSMQKRAYIIVKLNIVNV